MISPGVFFLHFFEVFVFWSVRGGKRAKNSPKWKISIMSVTCHITKNSLAYDHDFWYTFVKWWYLQAFFFFHFSWNFHFLGCYLSKRAKNSPKWKITSVMRQISETAKHMIMIFVTLVLNDDIPGIFFIFFFEVFIFFCAVRG